MQRSRWQRSKPKHITNGLKIMIFPLGLRHPLAFCILHFALCISASAQTIQLRDGTAVPTLGLRRDGDNLAAKVKTNGDNVGEVGYPLANVVRVDFPEPALLKAAADLLDKGQADEAVRQLAPAVAYYLPFYNVPGNYWKPLAVLQLEALTAAHRDKEADAVAAELGRLAAADPEVVRTLKIREGAGSVQRGDATKALATLEPIVHDDTASAAVLAPAWIQIGAAHLARREFKPALLAYLHIPVYTPERARLMPAALLGSARAYLGLEDKQRAEIALNELLTTYPAAAEAAEARQQLQKLDGRASNPTPGG